jgi:hypothetical protein
MKLRFSLFVMALFFMRSGYAVTIVTPTDPMTTNPTVYYLEDFSTSLGALYPQHPGNGTWSVQNGKLVANNVGSPPSVVAAPESEDRMYQNRSIHCDITVNAFEQSAMIVLGYTRDALGNDYFLCAGVYKGRWGIGYYPNEETGDFALLKSYDYGSNEISAEPLYQWTSCNVKNPFGTNDGYGHVYNVRLDVSENTIGLFVNNSELPYLKFVYDYIPTGSIGLMVRDSSGGDVIFDNFKVTDLARNTPSLNLSIPYEQNFNNPTSALQGIRFSHRNNWRVEVDGSGNGSLIVENVPNYKTAIAAFEGIALNNNFQVDCTITFLSENAVASIFFPLRGLAGYDAGASRVARMYIRSLSKWPEVSCHLDITNSVWGFYWNDNLQINTPYNVTLYYKNGLLKFLLNGREVRRWTPANDLLPSGISGMVKQMIGLGCEYQEGDQSNGIKFDNFRVTNLEDEWVPSADDLSLTPLELKKSTNSIIDKLITQYDGDPLSLYRYLLNDIETVPGAYGSVLVRSLGMEAVFFSNAEGVLWRANGSSDGQSFALMSFLRSCNIPCRLVGGPVTMRARDWNRLYNEEVHTFDGTPVDPSWTLYRYKYWVEAKIGTNQVSLFPWLKFYETINNPKLRLEDVLWASSTNYPNRIGVWPDQTEAEPISVELVRKMIDPNSAFFPKDSAGNLVWGTDQPIPILKNYIRNYLETTSSAYSLDQVGTLRKLQPTRVTDFTTRPPEILSAQPYTVINLSGAQADTNNPMPFYRAKFKLKVQNSSNSGFLEKEFYAYDLVNSRIVLSFIPWASISASAAATPVLSVEGVSQGSWSGSYPTYGTSATIKCTWLYKLDGNSTNIWQEVGSRWCRVGDVVNCFVDTGGVSHEMVDECYKRLRPVIGALGTNTPPSNPAASDFEPYWGSLLHLLQVKWSGYVHETTLEANALLSSNSKIYYKPGFTVWNIENQGTSYFMGGMLIDQGAGLGSWSPLSLSQDTYPGRTKGNWSALNLMIGSSYEHQVFYDVFGSKTAGSTYKYLRQTEEQGGSVREIKGFADFNAHRTEIESELTALENAYGTSLGIYSDLGTFFTNSPNGSAWLPSIVVTNVNLRSIGWLTQAGVDTNGVFQWSSKGGAWIHTKFQPAQ